jgi:polyhydroxyalkanoate synthesis repressor PhaR
MRGEVMGGNLITNQETTSKAGARTKIIKRYQNRKLYDTQQSCYVTLDDIAKMIRNKEDVMVIDNKTKNDITAATLTQIIFEAEKKSAQYAPLFTLREIIQNGNGSISSYLAKLGAFPLSEQMPAPEQPSTVEAKPAFEDMKQSLENRVASAATNALNENPNNNTSLPFSGTKISEEVTLSLPNSNKTFDN